MRQYVTVEVKWTNSGLIAVQNRWNVAV